MIEPSTTRRRSMPCTRNRSSTTAVESRAHATRACRMKDCRACRARELQQLRVTRAAEIGRPLFGDVAAHRRLAHDATQKLHSLEDGVAVDWAGQIARLDRWRLARVGRLDAHEAAALRSQLTDRCNEAREWVQGGAGGLRAENDEVHLDVGSGSQLARAKEPSGIAGAYREQPLSEQRITQPGTGAMPPAVDHVVHRDPLRAAILHPDLKMILQVGPDPQHVGDDAMPSDRNSGAGPSPDSCRSCGELNVPPARMTSAFA